ncbi:CHD5 domain protein [Ceratobasidium sp. AG-Ba]|nr:CHD5 domain protein [Ceratobasidium sp. AG-Ba]
MGIDFEGRKVAYSDSGSYMASVACPEDPDHTTYNSLEELWDVIRGDLYEKPSFSDVVEDNMWLTSAGTEKFTFVFDMDHRAFSVLGIYHFNMDNMPPVDTNIITKFTNYESISASHKTFVSYWPRSTFDVDAISAQYTAYRPRVLALHDWGAPTWESLSVSQSLSIKFAKSLMHDYRSILSNASLRVNFGIVVMLCWRIVCAAAPTHLFYVARAPERFKNIPHVSTRMFNFSRKRAELPVGIVGCGGAPTTPRLDMNYEEEPFPRPYCWFRGCLVKFCLRLDEDIYAKAEVVQMVDRLKNSSRAGKAGIIISSYQLVVVAVDGTEVRHSPVLDLHDNKGGEKDGLLMLVHLLRPAFTVCDTARANPQAIPSHASTTSLPEDVIRHILSFTDEETYHFALPYVSRLVRAICLSRPRIGDYIILAPNEDRSYHSCRTTGTAPTARVKISQITKMSRSPQEHSFFTQQTGIGQDNKVYWIQRRRLRDPFGPTVPWHDLVKGDKAPMIRVLVLEGMWSVKEVPAQV